MNLKIVENTDYILLFLASSNNVYIDMKMNQSMDDNILKQSEYQLEMAYQRTSQVAARR